MPAPSKRLLRKLLTLSAILIAPASHSLGQSIFYTHTSGVSGDGFTWDAVPGGLNDLPDGSTFDTPDAIEYFNYIGNTTFFDDNYLAAGNSSVIDGDAWWGNPTDDSFPQVGFGFYGLDAGGVSSLDFDFAWAVAGQDASDYLEIEIYGYDVLGEFASTYYYADLNELFNAGGAFGGFLGAAGSVSLDVVDLFDDFSGEPFDLIEEAYINLYEIADLGGTSEFAVDNVAINGAVSVNGSNVFPSVNDGIDVSGASLISNVLENTGVTATGVSVTNNGDESTTFSTEVLPGGDLTAGPQANGLFIDAGQTVFNADLVSLDSSLPSGEYESDVRVINDLNSADADDDVTFTFRVHEPPQLTANNGAPVDVDGGEGLTLDNAAASGAEAFRAGVTINGFSTVGPFGLTGVVAGDEVLPDSGVAAGVTFSRFGQISGTIAGTAIVPTSMVSESGFFLRNAAPVDDVVWDLQYDLADVLTDSASFGAGESYNQKIGVNTSLSAATITAGESPSAQTVSMDVVPDTGTNGLLASDAVDVEFSASSGLYVLQFTYDAAQLPGGITETDLRLLVLDEGTNLWDEAILENSDGGAGGSLFLGPFGAYLAGPGGGTLDASDLSVFGVDTANGWAWAVLDHASVFSLGVLQADLPGDADGDGDVDGDDLIAVQTNFGSTGAPPLTGDADGDGDVDGDDLIAVQTNFGATLAVAVPEPSGVALLAALLATLPRRRYA